MAITVGSDPAVVAQSYHYGMETKYCKSCNRELPVQQFALNSSKKDGMQSSCKDCKKVSDRKYHVKNRSKIQERNKTNRQKAQQYLYDYVSLHPCVKCGESDPVVLEFDHIDRASKNACLSKMANNGCGKDMLDQEISKCQILCANCHRRKTAQESESFRWVANID